MLAIRDIANGGCNEGMLAGKRTQADLERRLRPVVSPCEHVEVAAHSADAEMFRISTTVVDVSCAEALGQPQLAALPDHLSRLAPNKANTWRLPNTMRPDASMITTASGANSSTLLSTSIDLPIRQGSPAVGRPALPPSGRSRPFACKDRRPCFSAESALRPARAEGDIVWHAQ